MSGQPVPVAEWSRERLVVFVPDGARTGHFELARPSGERARSPQRFRVVPQRPVVERVNPDSGPPGTRVRITGSGFTPRDRVMYGSIATPVLGRGSTWVDVEVPRRAPRSQHFQLRGAAGSAKSPEPFALIRPPKVRGFSPRRGAPGTHVEIRGQHFRDGDWVALAGKRLPITHVSEVRIAVTIPVGSPSGELTLGRERHESSTIGRFEVLNPPTLTAFTPTRGGPGTEVTLHGTHLDRAEVYFGRERIPVRTRRAGTSLVVAIPRAARDDRFRVTTRAGSAHSQQAFQVQYHTVIDDVTPRAGVPGTTLVVRGRHMDKAEQFAIGSTRLELVRRDNQSATLRVPEGARSAPFSWVSYGRHDRTPWRFDVLAAPVIMQFQPTSGAAGAEIIIRGDHLDRQTEVFFGRRKLRVVRLRAPHEIAVQLPHNAGGADYLYLAGRGARTRSDERFEVMTAPVILSVAPSSARPGAPILVRGRWFTDATEILIGRHRARVLRRDLAGGSIMIEVPRGLPAGSHTMSARGDRMMSEHQRAFLVTPGSPRVSKE
jgi:IPT/TIG domain